MGRRTARSSQKSSRISCAAIMFSSRMMCSTYDQRQRRSKSSNVTPTPTPKIQEPNPTLLPYKQVIIRWTTYPDSRGGLLAGLEKLGDVLAHLAQLQLPAVPQQLYPRDGQLEQRLAVCVPRGSGKGPNRNQTRKNRPIHHKPGGTRLSETLPLGTAEGAAAAAAAAAPTEEAFQHRHVVRSVSI